METICSLNSYRKWDKNETRIDWYNTLGHTTVTDKWSETDKNHI